MTTTELSDADVVRQHDAAMDPAGHTEEPYSKTVMTAYRRAKKASVEQDAASRHTTTLAAMERSGRVDNADDSTQTTLQEWTIGDGLELLDCLDKGSVTLMILDLPYFKVVKNTWDNEWKTLDEYLDWCKEWFIKCERVLAGNGSLYYFNSQFKVIKAVDTLIESCTELNFRQFITIDKGIASVAGRSSIDAMRSYPHASECLGFYTFQDESGLTTVTHDINNFKSLRMYFKAFQEAIGINKLEIVKQIGHKADHCFRWGSTQWSLPTEETYKKLCELVFKNDSLVRGYEDLHREYEDLRREYEDLRREYEDLRYPFNLQPGYTDVWHFNFYNERRHGHPTQKPADLIKRIVLTSSNAGDLVCDPAMGTGTTMKVCEVYDRNFVGAEINPEYESAINNRCMTHTPPLTGYFTDVVG